MDNSGYVTLTRQSGLLQELSVIANNLANASTVGFRGERTMFSEHIRDLGAGTASLSMANAAVSLISQEQGALRQTGGTFDLAIEGEGFFLVQTPQGERLTRAGAFGPNANGDLVTPDGHQVLDAGGAPVFVPRGAGTVGISADGTISANGQPIGQIGLVMPADATQLARESSAMFASPAGILPAENGRILQGFVEESNVDPLAQISRMVAVQRAYELGQGFLDREDDRIRGVIDAVRR